MESSKSAIQTLAPEFSALMVIFRSTGPVISTRRSSSPGPAERPASSGSLRTASVSRQEPRVLPPRRSGGALRAPASSSPPPGERAVQLGDEGQRLGVRTSPLSAARQPVGGPCREVLGSWAPARGSLGRRTAALVGAGRRLVELLLLGGPDQGEGGCVRVEGRGDVRSK